MVLRPTLRAIPGGGARKCQSWIESFLHYTSEREAPEIWRRWTAIATISSVLERKVWAKTTKGVLYPNQYVILVGHPGTGKSDTIKAARELLYELVENRDIILAPNDTSAASLITFLAEAKRDVVRPGQDPGVLTYNACALLADEFSNLLHQYDSQFMAFLTAVYEGDKYVQTRVARGKTTIESPCLNLLAGTTPSHLCKFMPEGAWDQGFASRTILVYSGDRHLSDIFGDLGEANSAEYNDLLHDLRSISALTGSFTFTAEAKQAFQEWRASGEYPVPKHPKLTHYCTRRTAHVIRLCMVASSARSSSLQISLDDFETAQAWLINAEHAMPDIFLAGTTGGDSAAMDEAWWFVEKMKAKGKEVPEHEVIHLIRERVPAHSVLRVLEVMIADGSLKKRVDAKTGLTFLSPGPRKPNYG